MDIARRVKLFGGGSVGFTAANRDEVLQRDSATSAGEDEHDEHARGPASQSRVMLRRRRQFDAQGNVVALSLRAMEMRDAELYFREIGSVKYFLCGIEGR